MPSRRRGHSHPPGPEAAPLRGDTSPRPSGHGRLFAIAAAVIAVLWVRHQHQHDAASAGAVLELGDDDVTVKQSEMEGAGMGAFALRDFAKGERVGWYLCEIQFMEQNALSAYSWSLNATHVCDAAPIEFQNPMRYVNSIAALDTCGRQNLKMPGVLRRRSAASPISYVATRQIRRGEELLVDYGALYFKNLPGILAARGGYECGAPALHRDCMRGDAEAVRARLEGDATASLVNERAPADHAGWTPLMEAAAAGAGEVARLLLQHGARVDAADTQLARSALFIGSLHGRAEVVEILLREGHARADQANAEGTTPLFIAAQFGHLGVVEVLLREDGASVDKGTAGYTPLLIASQNGHAKVVEALLEGGAQVNLPRDDGATPLLIASFNGQVEAVKALLRGRAQVEQAASEGTYPLLIASEKGHEEVVRVLLQMGGATIDRARADGATPLLIACQHGQAEVVKTLLQEGRARGDQSASVGATPLLIAGLNRRVDVLKVLLQAAFGSMYHGRQLRTSPAVRL